MKLKVIHSTLGCEDTACPTVYFNDEGQFVFQGFSLEASDLEQMNVPTGETAIALPADFLQQFVQKVLDAKNETGVPSPYQLLLPA